MPNRLTPINSQQDIKKALQITNRNFRTIDADTYTQTISANGNTQMIRGKLPNGRFGDVFYDAGGMPRISIGQAPNNGRPGIWITKEGYNVFNEIK